MAGVVTGVVALSGGTAAASAAGDPAVVPAVMAACRPWQTPTVVPPGVTLTPRVFPPVTSVTPPSSTPPSSSPSTPAATKASGKARTVCRNAPPKPFTHPAWVADTVVGGPDLAADGVVVDLSPATPAPPAVYDVSYVVADLDSGEILAAKSPHAWLRPASTLKTLTALTLMPVLDPAKVVVASEDAQNAAGSRVGILAGNPYRVASLFDAMLMFSANDAVYALADAAGGYGRTVDLMNDTARGIGAYDTVVLDPSGLDEGNQRSSAYDLAVIAREAMRLPAFRTTIVKRDAVFPGGKDARGKVWKPFHITNINDLLSHYPGTIGVKPGRTDRAQHTFIGAATRGGRTLLVAQMGSITGSWKPTAALLDWGFANADRVTPVGRLVDPGEASPPVAAPKGALGSAPGDTGAGGSTGGVEPGAGASGTPAPVAAAARLVGEPGGLAVLAAVGCAVTVGAVLLVVAMRRRRRG